MTPQLLSNERQRKTRDLSFFVLLVTGLLLIVSACFTPVAEFVETRIGGMRFLSLVLGFAVLYLALLVREVAALRERNLLIMETLLTALRGRPPGADRKGGSPRESKEQGPGSDPAA